MDDVWEVILMWLVGVWKYGNMELWKYGSVEVRRFLRVLV